jgi:primase-polymerase (primpol)-like protein
VKKIIKSGEAASRKIASAFVALEGEPRWVEWRDDGGRKKPITPGTRRAAEVSNPDSWTPLSECRGPRVGIVFNGDGLGGVDLDGCRDPETGVVADWAREVLDDFQTYAEVSPSGTGIKLFAYGATALSDHVLPMPGESIKGKKPQIEAYATARYFTVTGNALPEWPNEIRAAPEAWQRLAARLTEHRIATGKSSVALSGRNGALFSLSVSAAAVGSG